MENKCSRCGGELIAGRFMTGAHLVGFMPLDQERKFRPKYTHVICDACVQCGSIVNIRVESPEKLR